MVKKALKLFLILAISISTISTFAANIKAEEIVLNHADHVGWTELTLDYIQTLAEDDSNMGWLLPAGKYYLSGDIDLYDYNLSKARLYIRNNSVVEICLNGYEFTGQLNARDTSTTTISSCKDNGKIYCKYCGIDAYDKTTVLVKNLEFYGTDTSNQAIRVSGTNDDGVLGATLKVEDCLIHDIKDTYYGNGSGVGISASNMNQCRIINTQITGNITGLFVESGNIELVNTQITGNDNASAFLRSAQLNIDKTSKIENAIFGDDSKLVVDESVTKNDIGVRLDTYTLAPYVISDTYSTSYKCEQFPYHIANIDGKAVLEYRIKEQPSIDNECTFKLDKNGGSVSAPIEDGDVNYQWFKVDKKDLTDYTGKIEVVDFFDELFNGTVNVQDGVCYVTGPTDATNNTITAIESYGVYLAGFAFKKDGNQPFEVSFTLKDDTCTLNDMTTYETITADDGVYTVEMFDYGDYVCGSVYTEQQVEFVLEDIEFRCSSTLEDQTTNKLTDYEVGNFYMCAAYLKEYETPIKSNIITIEHTHDWTYTLSKTNSDNDTVSATCENDNCDYEDDDLSLTIYVPDNLIADGTNKEANLGTSTSFIGDDLPVITYQYKENKDGTYQETTDTTKVGFYKASITVGEGEVPKSAYVEYEVIHEHDWTYTLSKTNSDNDTVSATCENDNCDYEDDDLVLTIIAPQDLTEDGNNKEANLGTSTSFIGEELPTIKYQYKENKDDLYQDTTDTSKAGFYKASITVGEGEVAKSAYVEYEVIAQNTPNTAVNSIPYKLVSLISLMLIGVIVIKKKEK